MARTYQLVRRQVIDRPIDEVFAFFAEPANLETITPEFLHFQIVTPRPIAMRPGTLIQYRLRLYGIPLRWTSRIEQYDPPRRFVDVQVKGPYRTWRHTHEFEPDGERRTRIVDRVEYSLGWGPLGRLAHLLMVRRSLRRIFDDRAQRLAALLSPDDAGHA